MKYKEGSMVFIYSNSGYSIGEMILKEDMCEKMIRRYIRYKFNINDSFYFIS